ncbi:hypothetical protein ACA910_022133 [Epithemia clementina (nom. ined.)]
MNVALAQQESCSPVLSTMKTGDAAGRFSATSLAHVQSSSMDQPHLNPNFLSKENVEVDTKKRKDAPEGNLTDGSPRRSNRTRVSTVIHVNGHTIKKDNNYVVKGMTYVHGFLQQDDKPNQQSKARKKEQPDGKHDSGKEAVPKKPRLQSTEEVERLKMKEAVENRRRSKESARALFLQEHLHVFESFCEPKVIQKIRSTFARRQSTMHYDTNTYMAPEAIQAELRDYQMIGLNWMAKMYSKNCGMILGDEMGLGKTLQTISLVCHLKEVCDCSGPSLVICPMTVLTSWQAEIAKWAPGLKYLRLHSSNSEAVAMESNLNLMQYDIVVATYEMAKAPPMRRLWSRNHFNLLVLDEGHRIKGIDTQTSQAVRRIHCECRIILTGTPLANNLVELYSLLSFLMPDIFTTSQPFEEAFDLNNNKVDAVKLEQAHKVLDVCMLRRLKNEVEKLMPKKIETKVLVPLSHTQIWWYKALLLKNINMLANAGMVSGKAKALSNLIMQLRKCCAHPFLFPGTEDDPDQTSLHELVSASGKLAVLDKLLRRLYQKGHRVVLFSQFTRVLDIIDDYCQMRGWNHCRFDGSTSRAKRNYIVNSFNAEGSDKFIFLMSTRSGGMGLNLQTADTCILFDSDWNPQPDCQAMARVHRIGQTKTVHVYRLVCEGTIEERMVERAEKKLFLERMVTRDGSSTENLNDDEEADAGRLLSALRFGCNAVFGDSQTNALPTDDDIEILTDRNRTEDSSAGKLKGGMESSALDYDATKAMTETTCFAGIDFKKIRESVKEKPKDIDHITAVWKKRQRKNRIKIVNARNTGWGSKGVPILTANDYDLQSGERSVFAQELSGKGERAKQPGKRAITSRDFQHQDFCQVCGDGGELICCPRCPVSVHLECAGVGHAKEFLCCSHHHCSICHKAPSNAGGMIFPCCCCPNAYCEDHMPKSRVPFIDNCERMEKLGFDIQRGVYIHCSDQCERVAVQEFGWKPQTKKTRSPCPLPLDVSESFGGKVDEFVDVPDDLIVQGKRNRKKPKENCSVGERPRLSTGCSSEARSTSIDVSMDATEEVLIVGVKAAPASRATNPATFSSSFIVPSVPCRTVTDESVL